MGGHVKIADFGVSGTITNTIDCMTSWVGTVTYMSPERIQGESYFSDTDLWSLGIMLLECSMGRFPYPSPHDDIKELGFWELMQYITLKPSPTIPDGEGYSAEFKDFISILLRKKGGSRSTAIELLLHPWMKSFEEVDKKHLRRWLRSLNEKAE
jgi:mitogen-activated protein kinase kinase 1